MEVIEFSGYIDYEKLSIAKSFLVPRHLEEHGLTSEELEFTDHAVRDIIRDYTYESGVRNLDREIGQICRKVVRRLMQGRKTQRTITHRSLAKYLGPPKYISMHLDKDDQIGVATGLAWTSAGGDILPVEVTLYQGKGNLTLTGQLGDVMQESIQAALSYIKANSDRLGIDPGRFESTDIHIHVPEGATPKDGPSAGITMATAIVSAFSGRKVRRNVAMTGEVTLRGRVIAIGGLRVKAMAAHRVGIKTIIIPEQNMRDLLEIPSKMRQSMKFVLAKTMDTVLETALLPTATS
jgi:ATP-dependent Lon protease